MTAAHHSHRQPAPPPPHPHKLTFRWCGRDAAPLPPFITRRAAAWPVTPRPSTGRRGVVMVLFCCCFCWFCWYCCCYCYRQSLRAAAVLARVPRYLKHFVAQDSSKGLVHFQEYFHDPAGSLTLLLHAEPKGTLVSTRLTPCLTSRSS